MNRSDLFCDGGGDDDDADDSRSVIWCADLFVHRRPCSSDDSFQHRRRRIEHQQDCFHRCSIVNSLKKSNGSCDILSCDDKCHAVLLRRAFIEQF